MFKGLSIRGWRQFKSVDIAFHSQLTVLTGANGAGKSTLLNIIGRHFGWQNQLISTPLTRKHDAILRYTSDYWNIEDSETLESLMEKAPARVEPTSNLQMIGSLEYMDGGSSTLSIPINNPGSVYDIHHSGDQHIEGLHIPSHRSTYSYQQVQSIPTVPRRRQEAANHFLNLIKTRYYGGHTQWSPFYYMKETLIALATFGYGNLAVAPDPESAEVFEQFQEVLRRMLPPKLGFQRLSVRVPEVVLETESGTFSIDAVSGGAAAIIELAWQVFMFQPEQSSFVVTLDEPENHLHPELQKRVLSDLIAAFPTVQFIVATHSPFIVGSVPNSNVYVLDYDKSRRVSSTLLDTANRAGTANEILRDVLGLQFTMPVWVDERLKQIVDRYSVQDFTSETLGRLRQELSGIGLAEYIPSTIAQLADRAEGA